MIPPLSQHLRAELDHIMGCTPSQFDCRDRALLFQVVDVSRFLNLDFEWAQALRAMDEKREKYVRAAT